MAQSVHHFGSFSWMAALNGALVHHLCSYLWDGCAEWRTWCTVQPLGDGTQTHQPSTSDALSFLAPVLPHCLPDVYISRMCQSHVPGAISENATETERR